MGWSNRRHSLLGAKDGWRQVSNLCDQLHSSRMSRALVSGIAPLHVSVSRRRFLRRRFACIGAAAAWTLRIQVQSRERTTVDTWWPAADLEPAGLKGMETHDREIAKHSDLARRSSLYQQDLQSDSGPYCAAYLWQLVL